MGWPFAPHQPVTGHSLLRSCSVGRPCGAWPSFGCELIPSEGAAGSHQQQPPTAGGRGNHQVRRKTSRSSWSPESDPASPATEHSMQGSVPAKTLSFLVPKMGMQDQRVTGFLSSSACSSSWGSTFASPQSSNWTVPLPPDPRLLQAAEEPMRPKSGHDSIRPEPHEVGEGNIFSACVHLQPQPAWGVSIS